MKIIRFLHPSYHQKMIEDIAGDVQKTSTSVSTWNYNIVPWFKRAFKRGYVIIDDENEAENQKQIT